MVARHGDNRMNRLKIVTVLVHDQDAAKDFYTRKLGFEVVEDKAFGKGRWVTISIPKNRDLTLALEQASGEDKAIVGKQAGSHAFFAVDTSDCLGDYRKMKSLGVK